MTSIVSGGGKEVQCHIQQGDRAGISPLSSMSNDDGVSSSPIRCPSYKNLTNDKEEKPSVSNKHFPINKKLPGAITDVGDVQS